MTPERRDATEGPGSSAPAEPSVAIGGIRAGIGSLLVALLALAATIVAVVYITRLTPEPHAPGKPTAGPGTAPRAGPGFITWGSPKSLPQLQFTDKDGRALSLADFRGKVVLLNIWATWCPPCRKEMPSLDRLQSRLGGPDFEVVAVSIDQGNDTLFLVEEFFREIGVKHLRIFLDQTGGAARTLGALGLPVTLLVDRRGMELGRLVGPAEWDGPEAVALVKKFVESLHAKPRGGAS